MKRKIEEDNRIPTGLYIRTATRNKKACKMQETFLKEWFKQMPEYKIVKVYIDNGKTGTTLNRRKIIRIIRDMKAGKIKVIGTENISRLARNLEDHIFIMQKAKQYNAEIKSRQEGEMERNIFNDFIMGIRTT